MDADRFASAVREYLAYCAKYSQVLNRDYHPTADGAVKMIFHRGTNEASMIRAAFADVTGQQHQPALADLTASRRLDVTNIKEPWSVSRTHSLSLNRQT